MKARLLLAIVLGILSTNISAQFFFIPVILPTNTQYVSFTCPSRNKLAIEYFQKGSETFKKDVKVSIGYYKDAIMKDSLFCDAYYCLTICYRKTKEYDSALKYIDASLKVNASDFWARKVKGLIYMDKEDYNTSAAYYNKLKIEQPEECVWLYYLSRSLIELNQLDSAKRTTLAMQFLMHQQGYTKSQQVSTYLQSKIAFKKGDFNTALRAYKTIETEYNKDAEFCYYYGLCYLNTEKPNINKAKRLVQKAIKLGYNKVDQNIVKKLNI
jgi:tetratricopeptide (TPR) repeat protein